MNPMLRSLCLAASVAFSGLMAATALAHDAAPQHATGDVGAIRHAMMAQFDKPSDRLSVDPIVIQGNYAVAGWIQSGRGGRAVLQKDHGKWVISVCGGDGLKDAAALAQTGMSAANAGALAKALASAESKLKPDMLAKFAMFDGIVKVDASHGSHGAQAHHGAKK